MIYEIHLLINTEKDTCQISGTDDPWLDLGLLMEAVGTCMGENRALGKSKEDVEKRVYDYLAKVKEDYKRGGEITQPVRFEKPQEEL